MRKLAIVFLITVVGLVCPVISQAITLGFNPASQTKQVGDYVAVDVVVTGLRSAISAAPQIVSTFDLDVTFDSAILGYSSVTFGSSMGSDFDTFFSADGLSTPGRIDFAALSMLSDADFLAMQEDSVTLATLNFTALSNGTSKLLFDALTSPGIDVKGLNAAKLEFGTINDGEVIVTDDGTPPAVPEPGTILLLGGGLAGLAFFRRKNRSK